MQEIFENSTEQKRCLITTNFADNLTKYLKLVIRNLLVNFLIII